MKIKIKEDGSLLIDGEGDTTIVKDIDVAQNIDIQIQKAYSINDWIKIEGGNENASHEAINFYLKHEASNK